MSAGMSGLQGWVLGYLVNAAWQGVVLCAAAWLLARAMLRLGPVVEHRIWCAALVAETLLPALWLRPIAALWGGNSGAQVGLVTVTVGEGVATGGSGVASALWAAITVAYGVVVVYFAARLAWRVWRTRELVRRSVPLRLEGAAAGVWERCCARIGWQGAQPLASDGLDCPVTVGFWRRCVILPYGFVEQVSEAELEAAMAHECAHVQRRDFAKNLLYEALLLPVAWHPAAWFTRAQVTGSREIVCDAMAAEAMAGRQVYVRVLLQLASAMAGRQRQPNLHVIGVFDGVFDANRLEERVMRLTERSFEVQGARRVAMAALCVAVSVGTVAAAAELRVGVASRAATVVVAGEGQTGAVDGAKAARVSGGVMAGNILTRVAPVYPPDAKAAGVQGSVVLRAIIGKDGAIENLQVVTGPDELKTSALDAVRQWVYKPYLLNGEPTEVETTITVNYTLQK